MKQKPTETSVRPTSSGRGALALLVIVYTLLLAGVYHYVVSPRFAYLGFVDVDPPALYLGLAVCTCGLLALFLPSEVTSPSDLGRIVVYFIITIPAVIVPLFLSEQWLGPAFETQLYGVVAYLVLTGSLAIYPRGALLSFRLPPNLALYFLLGLAAAAVLILGASYGFSIQIHSLGDVYDQREIYSEGGGGNGFLGLATGLLQNVLAPIFLVVGIQRRSAAYTVVGLALFMYVYTVAGLRTALVGAIFVVGVYWLARKTPASKFTRAWTVGGIFLVCGAWLASSLPGFSVVIDIVIRRILLIQGVLAYNYIEIFEQTDPTYFSHTILRVFFTNPFDGYPPDIVGKLLLGHNVHANASFIADGYVAGKILGVVVSALVVGLFLVLLDDLSRGISTPTALAATSMGILVMTQTSVLAALLTHGGIALLICLLLANSTLAAQQSTNTVVPGLPAKEPTKGSRSAGRYRNSAKSSQSRR